LYHSIEVQEQKYNRNESYDCISLTNKIVFASTSTSLRMNFVTHFNANKKIDRYITTYDRTVIIRAMGKDILQKK
jgi:hypothetical protein